MKKKPKHGPEIQHDPVPANAPQAEPVVPPMRPKDWVDEVKQWCLTGSRQSVAPGLGPEHKQSG
jgi:hypothetical protein